VLGLGPKKGSVDDAPLLRERIRALEDEVRALKSELKTIQGEWAETHTQLMRQANRLRRYQAVDGSEPQPSGEMPTERLHSIPNAVLARRRGPNGIHS